VVVVVLLLVILLLLLLRTCVPRGLCAVRASLRPLLRSERGSEAQRRALGRQVRRLAHRGTHGLGCRAAEEAEKARQR
jgi:hypothetical protein